MSATTMCKDTVMKTKITNIAGWLTPKHVKAYIYVNGRSVAPLDIEIGEDIEEVKSKVEQWLAAIKEETEHA